MNFILRILIATASVLFGAWLLPGIDVRGAFSALMVALVLVLLNVFIKPLLVIITIPVTILTLGLFLLVINAVVVLMADALVIGFSVSSFWSALLFSIFMSLINSIFQGLADRYQ